MARPHTTDQGRLVHLGHRVTARTRDTLISLADQHDTTVADILDRSLADLEHNADPHGGTTFQGNNAYCTCGQPLGEIHGDLTYNNGPESPAAINLENARAAHLRDLP